MKKGGTKEKMEKWIELERQLCQEGTLLPERTRAEVLQGAFAAGRLAVEERGGHIVAIAAIWLSPHARWWEVGTIWVDPNCRGEGLAGVVLRDALQKLVRLPGDGAFLITFRPGVAALAISHGWVETSWDASVIPPTATAERRHRHTSGKRPLNERRLFFYPLRVLGMAPTQPAQAVAL